jgi:hypothetical protein
MICEFCARSMFVNILIKIEFNTDYYRHRLRKQKMQTPENINLHTYKGSTRTCRLISLQIITNRLDILENGPMQKIASYTTSPP